MLRYNKIFKSLINHVVTASVRSYQVTVVGGASEIGQTLSLMLRAQPSVTKLVVHDTKEYTPGVVMDLSHIPTDSTITGFNGNETLERALKDSSIILVAGGEIQKPGITQKEWFSKNIEFIKYSSSKISKLQPMPFVGILTEPINILVPIAAEILKHNGGYDPKKLFGITTIDSLKAQTLYAMENSLSPRHCFVPVIGGHSNKTLIPLLSQCKPTSFMTEKFIQELTTKIRKWDDFVTQAKKGWSPTLAMAYSALIFTRSIIEALDGRTAKVQAFIENNDFGTSYFSGLVYVDINGASEMQRYTNLSQYECHMLENSIVELRRDVIHGKKILEFA